MTAAFPLNRKHYPKVQLDTTFIKDISLEDVAVPVNVYIEGNIAAGKTELLRLFRKKKILSPYKNPWINGQISKDKMYYK
jgi:hypothetical protein